ncbi:MAG: carboxypeptidase regulatory-like domain-containing protein [Bryobacterales bacterium]|nr:carboxypeptidase regulatory-like domain-containing protein [Bryobacterales bacterium]
MLTAAGGALLRIPRSAGARLSGTQSQTRQAYAVVAGTVFRDDGRALGGARVTLKPAPEEGTASRGKSLSAVADQRGEFAFRVPAGPMRYNVAAEAPGFKAQGKLVSVSGDERVDIYFQLEREGPAR